MRDFDERTIWTSDRIPLMASYNKGFAFNFCVINSFPCYYFSFFLFFQIGIEYIFLLYHLFMPLWLYMQLKCSIQFGSLKSLILALKWKMLVYLLKFLLVYYWSASASVENGRRRVLRQLLLRCLIPFFFLSSIFMSVISSWLCVINSALNFGLGGCQLHRKL